MPITEEFFTPGGVFAPPRATPVNEPAWLDSAPSGPGPQPGKGQLPLFPESGTLPAWTKVVVGLSLGGLGYSLDSWARPTLKASKLEQRNGVWGLLQRVVDTLTAFLDHGTNAIGHEVTKGYAHAAHGPAYVLGLQADRWNQLVWNVTYNQLETEQAIGRVVHTIIPRQTNHQTRPLRARTRKLEKGQARTLKQLTGLRVWTHRQIVTTIYPELRRLRHTVEKTLPQRIHREELKRGKLEIRQRHDHKLLLKLLPLLTVAGAVGLVLRAFSRLGLRYLECQNMKDVGNDLCASGPGAGKRLGKFLKGVLSGLGGILAPLFVCQLFEAAVVLVAPLMGKMIEVVGEAGSALCNGKHAAAPPLPLMVTADPPVPNPLPL